MRNVRWESSKTKSGTSRVTQESRYGEIISYSIPGLSCRSVRVDYPEPSVANPAVVRHVVVGYLPDCDVSYRAEEAREHPRRVLVQHILAP